MSAQTLPQGAARGVAGPQGVAAGGAQAREAAITIAEYGEFALIAAIAARFPASPGLVLGIGDDAAVLRAPDGRVVATTDMLLEGRHFRREWSAARDIGAKAAARNLADVAAMGARPTALLVSFAGPGDLEVDWVLELADGIAEECAVAGAGVAGGDTSGADAVLVAITALGDLAGSDPVTRHGARPGDVVAVAGSLGGAAAGLALLSGGIRRSPDDAIAGLIRAHQRPAPPYDAGPEAAALGATAMIDVSDGLLADLGHVARASGVTIQLSWDLVAAGPAAGADELGRAADLLGGADWREWVLAGGDDYALAAAFPAGSVLPERWNVIGAVAEAGQGRSGAVTVDGQSGSGPGGWQHFRGPVAHDQGELPCASQGFST
ncbi:MAG: thiamine-phosphate kinase [Streptosporangiaceae bacterium]